MRATLLIFCVLLTVAASAGAKGRPFKVPTATFQELFGISEIDASGLLGSDLAGCLKLAHADFNAAASGRDPPHSTLESMVADGGTTNWRGKCYDLTILMHGVGFRSGNKCYLGFVFGPHLRIRDRTDWAAPISRTQLVGLQREPCR
jgi:hypothetical protein